MRQLAWLNAVPKPPPGSNRAKADHQPLRRIEQMKAQKLRIKLPPNPAPIVIDHLNEMGLTEAAGMGAAPLSWQTLFAWQQVTGVLLPAWEARLIRHLSSAYLTESRKAESENCPAPWRGEITQSDRDAEDRLLREALGI